ncbi:phospholipase D family protein [Patescibacteria group bacterium]|nr:phospholipase D family protein [Patescibacteria group bacterium]
MNQDLYTMPKKDFILQGFTSRTHTEAILRLFDIPDIKVAIFSVAFVTDEGVRLIEEGLRGIADRTSIFVGIRNEITTKQGLVRLLDMGITLYAVDTGARGIVFHPKLYLTKNATEARLVIGSANLTLGGLNNNIEASVTLDLDLADENDLALVNTIVTQFSKLPEQKPQNIFLITSPEELDSMQTSGRLLDEYEALPPRPLRRVVGETINDAVPRIQLSVPIRSRTIRRRATPSTTVVSEVTVEPSDISTNPILVWQSKPLTRRDLDIPEADVTHAAGSINLDKGLLDTSIDHRHYFREEIFGSLTWSPTNKETVEEAHAQFQLVIKDISYGTFNLRIGHTTDTESTAYLQHNAMTRLSWGDMKTHIARPDLIGRTMSLYQDEKNPDRFFIEID